MGFYNMFDQDYHTLLEAILRYGTPKTDRTGVGTRSIFGHQIRFDLNEGFPLLTTKKIYTKAVIHELLWFLTGSTNVKDLQRHGVTIWDEWADPDTGSLGPIYGKQWRAWENWVGDDDGKMTNKPIDQIAQQIVTLRTQNDSRRMVVSAWNPSDIPKMALASCHALFQLNARPMGVVDRLQWGDVNREDYSRWVLPGGEQANQEFLDNQGVPKAHLDLQLYQRSADVFLGVPFNIASYAFLTHMLAQVTNMVPGHLIVSFGDVHLYNTHTEQAKLQLSRDWFSPPKLKLWNNRKEIDDFRYEDFEIVDYQSHPAIQAPVAV